MVALSHEKARKVYDRIGSFQDSQSFYEDEATELLIKHGRFEKAKSVFEFGCGTGRFALNLFENYLDKSAIYCGHDVSTEMIRLANEKLGPFSDRATAMLTGGGVPSGEPGAEYDRFVSNYVFDLLSEEDIPAVVSEAHRILKPEGLLCLSGLSTGTSFPTSLISGAFGFVQSIVPSLVGGCRPIDLLPFIEQPHWHVDFHEKISAYGITSEALVARRA
jgi:ubiquinone/menaquinone biosynthesis C-methylase UbiE